MPRELQKDLFGQPEPLSPKIAAENRAQDWSKPIPAHVVKELVFEVQQLKKQLKDLESRNQKLENKMKEWSVGAKVTFDRLNSGLQRMDQFTKSTIHEMQEKYAYFSARLTDRTQSDNKVEEMVSRHNSVVGQFELRMKQMQKLMSEQEMKLMNYQSTLKEIQRQR